MRIGIVKLCFFISCGVHIAHAAPIVDAFGILGTEIEVDGRLTEAPWAKAKPSKGMTERQPQPGLKAPMDFKFQVLYDDKAVYFGIETALMPGESPRSLELRRDTYKIWSDDAITIKIDVHQDKMTTIGFAFNAAGAQTDYIAITNSGGFRREYDAVWESVSTWDNDRWIAEVRIPYTALGLPESSGVRTLGLNVTRDHNKRLATYDWSPLPPELGPVAATHYGQLTGLKHSGSAGRPLRAIPYVLSKSPSGSGDFGRTMDLRAGGDLRVRLSQELWGEFTAFTDFAEVDLDDALINLTRFPLFLPEKRPFFLSGLDVFSFGDSGAHQLFYSRRIGLDAQGNSIPLIGGAKVHGRIGRLGVGILTVSTDSQGAVARNQYSVLRLRQDFEGQGTLGVLWVNRFALSDDATDVTHQAIGLDGGYRFLDDRLQLSGYAALTINQEEREVGISRDACDGGASDDSVDTDLGAVFGASSKLRARYVGSSFESDTQIRQVGCNFDPQVGFASRRDVRSLRQYNGYFWRGLNGTVTRAAVGHGASLTLEDQSNRYLGLETDGVFGVSLLNRWRLETTIGYAEDVVDKPFELPNGRQIEAGTYGGRKQTVYFSGAEARNPYGSVRYSYNDGFYGGVAHGLNGGLGGTLGAHLRVSARLDHTWLMFDDVPTDQTTSFNGDLNIALNPRLFADMSLQANTVNQTGRVLARLRWRYYPGSDLYLVYQDQLDVDYDKFLSDFSGAQSNERSVTLKLTYWYEAML